MAVKLRQKEKPAFISAEEDGLDVLNNRRPG